MPRNGLGGCNRKQSASSSRSTWQSHHLPGHQWSTQSFTRSQVCGANHHLPVVQGVQPCSARPASKLRWRLYWASQLSQKGRWLCTLAVLAMGVSINQCQQHACRHGIINWFGFSRWRHHLTSPDQAPSLWRKWCIRFRCRVAGTQDHDRLELTRRYWDLPPFAPLLKCSRQRHNPAWCESVCVGQSKNVMGRSTEALLHSLGMETW